MLPVARTPKFPRDALASILGPEPDESPRTTSVAEVTAHTAKRKETRKKEKFEDKCAELNRWDEQNVDENAYAITEHCITIRETIRAPHDRYAGDPVTLRKLALDEYDRVKADFKLSNLGPWKSAYVAVMTKLVRYNAHPVKDGEWLSDLNKLMTKIGDEIVADNFYEMQFDPKYFDVQSTIPAVLRLFDKALHRSKDRAPRRGAAYAAELAIAEDSQATGPAQQQNKRQRPATKYHPTEKKVKYLTPCDVCFKTGHTGYDCFYLNPPPASKGWEPYEPRMRDVTRRLRDFPQVAAKYKRNISTVCC